MKAKRLIKPRRTGGYTLPPGSCLYQDKGFQGFFLPGITIVQPKKNRLEEN